MKDKIKIWFEKMKIWFKKNWFMIFNYIVIILVSNNFIKNYIK